MPSAGGMRSVPPSKPWLLCGAASLLCVCCMNRSPPGPGWPGPSWLRAPSVADSSIVRLEPGDSPWRLERSPTY
ncbi:hypothetical protein HYH02_005969 [Chlamydomonas schloesseri]|uniref:Secreted protein n=1 Tax=Chlamydomonas schloesseri TaxID=2026947 RepID=A0A835WKT4_9CHLO|nr:hypothetical protein HYH02_005969 [Chlamydomonas schloesseri]|eukprot:KAG2449222.1 hypothetical protein HYH02_005969 [Chlamydomonas schloesseri]